MKAEEFFEKAQTLRNNGQIGEAIEVYQQARNEVGDNKWLAAECLHMIGVAYYQDKKFEEAEKFLNQARDEFKKLQDRDSLAAVLRDLGQVARGLKDFNKAINLMG